MSNRVVPTAAAEDPDGADFVIEEKQSECQALANTGSS
jgi:hypothetical protein